MFSRRYVEWVRFKWRFEKKYVKINIGNSNTYTRLSLMSQ